MTRLADLHRAWSKEPEYRAEYERLGPEFALARSLIEAQKRARLTQAELAERMVASFAPEQSAAMSGELAESLGVGAQMEAIEAALATRPDADQTALRAEVQALIDGEVGRLGRG